MNDIFEVTSPGLLTTVQDLGRKGYQQYGLAVSGATDPYAHRMANILVCNSESAATIEITVIGPKIKVLQTAVLAITGGQINPQLNGQHVRMWRSFTVHEGDELSFKGCVSGCRAYIGVAGGIDVESVLGSRATDLMSEIGGVRGRSLNKGDLIHVRDRGKATQQIAGRILPSVYIPLYKNEITVRVVRGPQDDAFTRKGMNTFLSSTYTVSIDSDQMACRLEGERIEHATCADIASEGMFIGAIQVPENGLPILFQAGRPSIGGYTKIAGVVSVDLPKVAQLKPNDRISFTEIDLREAHELLVEQERLFTILNRS